LNVERSPMTYDLRQLTRSASQQRDETITDQTKEATR
jgi:hypothetical protein